MCIQYCHAPGHYLIGRRAQVRRIFRSLPHPALQRVSSGRRVGKRDLGAGQEQLGDAYSASVTKRSRGHECVVTPWQGNGVARYVDMDVE